MLRPRGARSLDAQPRRARGGALARLRRLLRASVSRAYYAAFCAAEEALLALGETRSKHSGALAAFESLVVRDGGIDPAVGRLLRSLFRRRNEADYGTVPASQKEAEQATGDAEGVIDAVESWLADRA